MRRITVFLSAILALGNDEVWHLRAEPAPVPLWVKPAVTEIAAGVWRLRYGQPEKFTPESMRAAPARMEGFKSLPVPGGTPLAWGDIRCRITPTRTVVYIPCDDASEKIYGFGLDPEAYQQNGLTKTLTMSAAVVGKTGAGHGPVPFYLSTKGYGVYVDTARVPTVQVARLAPNTGFAPKPDSGDAPKTSEAELYAPRPARGGREVIFDLPGAGSGVDVYIFGGPSMREAVQRYNLFAGGGAVPPLWGLGLKFRTYTRADQATVLKSARALRAMKIPCDMIGLEPGWQSRSYSCSFTWSPERFPTPETMLQELHESGFKVNLWEHAYIHPTSPMYPALKTRAGDYLVWSGLVVDFADPEAARIFSDFHEQHLVSLGILGFKGDECDKQPFSDATPFNYPYSTAFPSGIDGDQMTQLYGYLYQKSLNAPFQARNLRTWGDVRATTALAAPLPFNLYSDAYSFEQYLRQLVNASFTGLLWSPEVRQAGTLNEFLNRLAMSALAPQMCLDMWFMPNPVWEQFDRARNEKNELLPAAERDALADQIRTIVNRRYELLPYLYSAFQKYHREGLPPVRSLLLDFPDDPQLREVDNEFLFGDALLAAPFLGEATSRKVILPRGVRWFELKTQHWHSGGATVTAAGAPGEVPLFVRENSLLPFAKPVNQIKADTVFKLTVKAFGAKPAPFTLYEDDGTSFDFEHGDQNRLELNWTAETGGRIKRDGPFKAQRHEIVRWETAPLPP